MRSLSKVISAGLVSFGLLSVGTAVQTCSNSSHPPVVDLGYALYQARVIESNSSNAYLNFSNIRYAAPPLEERRFTAPAEPLKNRSAGVQDGSYGKICPQAYARWQLGANVLNPPAENESEDCLFLDVVVPKTVYESNASVPVLVWFHGGGYAIGSKYAQGSPVGLLDRSFEAGEGAIWVGMNYRLGAFGFLQGDTIQANGTANAGFHDQRAALNWVQENIYLFGGDKDRVTAIGESAGGGSILHHITAYGGKNGPAPFQKAILQSTAFVPSPSADTPEIIAQAFLRAANVTSIEEARGLSSEQLLAANKIAQASALFGTYVFGPAPDGSYVPDLPGKLLLNGSYDRTVTVMAAHNSNEAGRYTDPAATNDTAFDTYMALYFPSASSEVLSYLSTVLYPPLYDGSQPYASPFYRLNRAISDFTFTCSSTWLMHAYNTSASYKYQFSVPPGNHTQDVPYTYFSTLNVQVLNETLAKTMQGWMTSFAQRGDPNRDGLPSFPAYGAESKILNLNRTYIPEIDDPMNNERCLWWQKALYR
ncbi:acetylcholinesterase [Phlyctema vagabunda]|uniref:Acetylcholinesterase n=1 Tax=Phlyctema vagabunda TaxID=108571 RepID=A0ABR4PRD4_9HELO